MSLVKYKNPTEYTFDTWIKNYPESTHWADRERFLKFVKTVCAYNAKNWKNTRYLEEKILKEKPEFDKKRLQNILITYEYLIDFYKAPYIPRCWSIEDVKVKPGFYIERKVKNGKLYERELPIEK